MSYNKLGFEKGQVLKAEHLNHMEEGIANAAIANGAPNALIIKITNDNYAYSNYVHTYFDNYDQIYECLTAGGSVQLDFTSGACNYSNITNIVAGYYLDNDGLHLVIFDYNELVCGNGSYHTATEK